MLYYRSLPYQFIAPIIIFPIIFWWIGLPELLGMPTFVLITVLIVVMEPLGYFLVEHAITPRFTPLLIYANGVERSLSKIDRMRRKPSFLMKLDIEKVVFKEYEIQDIKQTIRQCYVAIHMRDRSKVGLGNRSFEGSQHLAGVLRGELRVMVEWQAPKKRTGTKAKKGPIEATSPTRTNFCGNCGSKLDQDDVYCVGCGRKVE